jgi:dipeptidase E
MLNCVLASTSTVYGKPFLSYLLPEISELFNTSREIIFIPYAQPGGISFTDYTEKVSLAFRTLNITVKGLHEFENPNEAISQAQGLFIGGGNTFVLLKTIYDLGLIQSLKKAVTNGTPYLGTSAGTNICGPTICTTNDMPIVYPPSFDSLNIVPFQINPHFIDADQNSRHMGETRATRIAEYHHHHKTPVLGLREGSYVELKNGMIKLKGSLSAPLFQAENETQELLSGSDLSWIKSNYR